jgi:hypothetical protein
VLEEPTPGILHNQFTEIKAFRHLLNLLKYEQCLSHNQIAKMESVTMGLHSRLGASSLFNTLPDHIMPAIVSLAVTPLIFDRRSMLTIDAINLTHTVKHPCDPVWRLNGRIVFATASEEIAESSREVYLMQAAFDGRFKSTQKRTESKICQVVIVTKQTRINKTNYEFIFQYGASSKTTVNGISGHWNKVQATGNRYTGVDTFVLLLDLLESEMTSVDKGRKLREEMSPEEVLYASSAERIKRMLTVNGVRSSVDPTEAGSVLICFNPGGVRDVYGMIDTIDEAFVPTLSFTKKYDNGKATRFERHITVNGFKYAIIGIYANDRMMSYASFGVCGVCEYDEDQADMNQFDAGDDFSLFIDLLKSELTDEDRSRAPCVCEYSNVRDLENDDDDGVIDAVETEDGNDDDRAQVKGSFWDIYYLDL